MDEFANFKVSADSITIGPGLNIQRSQTVDVPPAPDTQDAEAHVPASVPTGARTRPAQKALRRKPGATLAEQLGTVEAAESEAPINPERIIPRVSRSLDAQQTHGLFTPKIPVATDPIESRATPEPPTLKERFPTDTKIDLKTLVLNVIDRLGKEQAAEYFTKSLATITSWKTGKADPPLHAVQKVLDGSSRAQQQFLRVTEAADFDAGSYAVEHTKENISVDLCLSVKGDIPPYCMWPFLTATLNYGIGVKMMTDTILIRSRNMVADMFLKGNAQWSIWIDGDVLPTMGSAPWWRAIVRDHGVNDATASHDFIKRLLSHNQPFVGGVYATRRKEGPLVIQPDLNPRHQADKDISNLIRKNHAKGLYEVDWLSIGLCVVHRSVFRDIKLKYPERNPAAPGEPYPYFTPRSNEGEDVAFSVLARNAGHKLYLDTELFAAHIGRYPFTPSESQYNGPIGFVSQGQV